VASAGRFGEVADFLQVAAADVAEVRRRVVEMGRRAGLPQDTIDRFLVAVNEIVINAVQHGGGLAEVTITGVPGRLTVEVRDHGTGFGGQAPSALPPVDQQHGRGLWLARQFSPELTFQRSATGMRVRLSTTDQVTVPT
jgi:serine/threonine-protein kinase RsbW